MKKFKRANLAKKAKAFKPITVTKAVGKVTYKKVSGSKKLKVLKNGRVVLKKGAKQGVYRAKVRVIAAGNSDYAVGTKVVAITVKVK